jgi:hypothetical protein
MTPIAEKAMIRRIQDRRNSISDLVAAVIKMADVSSVILDSLDQRIREPHEYVGWHTYIPYLKIHSRPQLFQDLYELQRPSGYELAELFSAGYGGLDIERSLCKTLYEIFRKNDDPLRSFIVDTLVVRGGPVSLENLEIIKYELDPEVKSKRVVINQIQPKSPSDEEFDIDEWRVSVIFKSLCEFYKRVNIAVDTLRDRQAHTSTESNAEERSEVAQLDFSAGSVVVTTKHKRLDKVEKYFTKANSFHPDHPSESLNNVRKALEAICKDLLDETTGEGGGQTQNLKSAKAFTSLEDMLSQVRRRKISPINIEKYFESLQLFGNFGSHDQDVDSDAIDANMAASVLVQLKVVVDWYKNFDHAKPCNQSSD